MRLILETWRYIPFFSVRKPAKHRERAKRPTSPYSTDSNYSTVQVPHKPYPKSERKKQLQEHGHSGHKYRNGNPGQERRGKPNLKAKPPFHNGEWRRGRHYLVL